LPLSPDTVARPAHAPPQRPWRSLLLALLWLLSAQAASIGAAVLAGVIAGAALAVARMRGAAGWQPDLLFYAVVATTALQLTLLTGALKQGRSAGRGKRAIGLCAGPMRRHGLITAFAGLAAAWVFAYVAILGRFHAVETYVAKSVPSVLALPISAGPVLLAVMLLLALVLAPVAEEFFFRGWLWTSLRGRWGVWPTALCTAALWLGMHALEGPVRVIILLPAAVLLSLARHYGGSVRASLLVHIVNNATAVLIQVGLRSLAGS
jgi:membrane protease YdiL (CAAX protease family)